MGVEMSFNSPSTVPEIEHEIAHKFDVAVLDIHSCT